MSPIKSKARPAQIIHLLKNDIINAAGKISMVGHSDRSELIRKTLNNMNKSKTPCGKEAFRGLKDKCMKLVPISPFEVAEVILISYHSVLLEYLSQTN